MSTHKKSQKSQAMEKSTMICLVLGLLLCLTVVECKKKVKPPSPETPNPPPPETPKPPPHRKGSKYEYAARQCRGRTAILTDFGGKGDGTTLNTDAFKAAVANLTNVPRGALLIVPPGRWLTGSFNLTSHFTLYIHQDAVILASEDESDYPLVKALPSYGVGRDIKGKLRYASLISGTNLTDVVITGGNGTIDGQGKVWWDKFKNKELNHSRPYLIEIISSNQVQISNLTLTNSSNWHVHPVYCDEVIIEHLTIIAPVVIVNTDGINPDSCTNTRIWDVSIISGDDCIAVKSGWDEYGIKVNKPTKNLSIRRLTCISPDSAVIALGSEMSGGIENVRAQDIHAINSQSLIRIKTASGRGGYVKDIYVENVTADVIKYLFWTAGDYKSHPDNNYNKSALPVVNNINFRNMVATNVTYVGSLAGISDDPFTGICVSNVTAELAGKKKKNKKNNNSSFYEFEEEKTKSKKEPWICTNISGKWNAVTPKPCDLLEEANVGCDFPDDKLAIDKIKLKTCSIVYNEA